MKKIVLMICLFFIVSNVNAKTYYGPYNDYSDYQLEKIEKSDTVSVSKEKFYHAYKETKRIEYNEEKNDNEYILEDGDWVDYQPEYYKDEKKVYVYKNRNPREIVFKNNTNENAYLKNIEVTNNGNIVYSAYYIRIFNDIVIPIFDYKLSELDIKITFSRSTSKNSIDMYIKDKVKEKKIKEFHDFDDITRVLDKFDDKDDLYDELRIADNFGQIEGILVESKQMYLEQKKLYKHEIIDKEYYDLYLNSETDDYKIDLEDYIYKYRYKVRDKIEIDDEIKLTSYDQELKDFIKCEELPKIISNVNKLINGKYSVTYMTSLGNIKKDVIVDINENYHILLKEQEKKLENMYDEYLKYNYLVNKKNQEIKEVINNSNDKYILSEYEKCKTKLKDEEIKKQDISNSSTKKKKGLIIVILTLFMTLGIFFKKFVER